MGSTPITAKLFFAVLRYDIALDRWKANKDKETFDCLSVAYNTLRLTILNRI